MNACTAKKQVDNMLREKLTKELIIQNNKPIEVWLYSPICGVLYASTLLKRNIEDVNKEMALIIADTPVEVILNNII